MTLLGKSCRKRLVLLLSFFCMFVSLCPLVYAQKPPLTEETKEFCNRTIANIYYDLLALKDKYPALKNFGEGALYENAYGIYAIVYENKDPLGDKQKRPYVFAITIDKLEDQTFSQEQGVFQYSFPLLNLKISGFQPKYILSSELDVITVVKKYIPRMEDYQQPFLPIRLIILPSKNLYHVSEEIELEIVLKNVSNMHLFVETLGPETLYFLFNNEFWGTKPAEYIKGGQRIVLRAGEEFRVKYRSDGFPSPREVHINCIYNMKISGVNPFGNYKIKIIE